MRYGAETVGDKVRSKRPIRNQLQYSRQEMVVTWTRVQCWDVTRFWNYLDVRASRIC